MSWMLIKVVCAKAGHMLPRLHTMSHCHVTISNSLTPNCVPRTLVSFILYSFIVFV